MFRTILLVFVGVLACLSGCIERYYPEEEDLKTGTLVVVAHLDNGSGIQTITLSRSVDLRNTSFNPVSGCFVQVTRSDGVEREFQEEEPGNYSAILDPPYLRTGDTYKLNIITPDGKQYESEYEIMHPAPGIKSISFEVEELAQADPLSNEKGIRFYIDFEIEKDSGRFMQWKLVETYEIQNPNYPTREYGTDRRWRDVPDTEKILNCWITGNINTIYTLDLGGVEGEVYRHMPLHFVSASSRRLYIRYSLLVRQLSLSEDAFWYWNELKKNVQDKGGLFDTQPAITPSNICNIDDGEELVIGYFSVSGCSEKRVFVEDVPDLELKLDADICAPGYLPMFLHRYPQEDLPFYVATAAISGVTESGIVEKECLDCRMYKGSSNIKPDFW